MITIRQRNHTVRLQSLTDRVTAIRAVLEKADAVIIGAGAGLSDAAGIRYSGSRFTENFKEFIDRYGMTDMYTAGFYPFRTEEEKWAYWSRHIRMNRFDAPAGEVYKQLLELVSDKPYFVITTNVDAQFHKAGFDPKRIWAVQGDYGKLQCAFGCHDKLYDAQELITDMTERQSDCRIPSELVPRCPVCGGRMEINIRKDMYFVQDQNWYDERIRYEDFLNTVKGSNIVFLELGVGYNTPTIIRWPFEKMALKLPNATLIRINRRRADIPKQLAERGISLCEDIQTALNAIITEAA